LSLDLVLSVLVLATIALTFGAVVAWRRQARQKAALMLVLAVICGINVAIWTLPDGSGAAPLGRELK
jgi:membrane protein DedA with SNARE-associated domain